MNNEELKADKARVMTELKLVKELYESDPYFALENLDIFGYNINEKGKITIMIPGGFFSFKIENIDRIIELVEAHYPEDQKPTYTNSAIDYNGELQALIDDAKHNLNTAIASGNAGLIQLFTAELDKVNARKASLQYA